MHDTHKSVHIAPLAYRAVCFPCLVVMVYAPAIYFSSANRASAGSSKCVKLIRTETEFPPSLRFIFTTIGAKDAIGVCVTELSQTDRTGYSVT